MELQARKFEVGGSPGDLQDWFEEQGWTDGLPVVPPTPELVEAMIAESGLSAAAELAQLAPSGAIATVEKIAINAVMAGCRPAYMPVVVAAIRAIGQTQFNLAAVQATTHPISPLIVVNGPVRDRIGLNCGTNVFGQGFRANATIGRAARLAMMNIGRGIPGKSDMSTMGSPAKFSFCIGENEEASPWPPFHVDHGMKPGDSAVLVHGCEPPHNIQDHGSATPDELLMTCVSAMNTIGNNNAGMGGEMLLVFCPEHARILADHGMSKDDVRAELHRRMRLRFATMGHRLRAFYRNRRPSTDVGPEIADIPFFDDPAQLLIMVAGGPGLHSAVLPSFGAMSMSAREKIAEPA
jgi:hypothetical protein